MGGLVAEDGQAGVGRAHQDDGGQVARTGWPTSTASADGGDDLDPGQHHAAGVADVVDAAQLLPAAEGTGLARREQPVRRQDVGQRRAAGTIVTPS